MIRNLMITAALILAAPLAAHAAFGDRAALRPLQRLDLSLIHI